MSDNRQTILVVGGSGQVGWELQRTLAPLGKVAVADQTSAHYLLNLAKPDSIRNTIREVRPDLIVNAAAYTAVDKAEEEADLAMTINGTAPGVMAEEAKRLGAALVHYSTDYVFDGAKDAPYLESDEPNPINVYGHSKLAGDRAIEAVGGAYLILRTSWIYGTRGNNFLLTMLRLSVEQESLKIVDDQTGSPTWSRMVGECTAQILARTEHRRSDAARTLDFSSMLHDCSGLYNLSSTGTTTWYGFAQVILEQAAAKGTLRTEELLPIPTSEYPVPAPRPTYSVLSGEKLQQTFGLTMPGWEQSVYLCMEDLRQKER